MTWMRHCATRTRPIRPSRRTFISPLSPSPRGGGPILRRASKSIGCGSRAAIAAFSSVKVIQPTSCRICRVAGCIRPCGNVPTVWEIEQGGVGTPGDGKQSDQGSYCAGVGDVCRTECALADDLSAERRHVGFGCGGATAHRDSPRQEHSRHRAPGTTIHDPNLTVPGSPGQRRHTAPQG